MQRDDLKEVAIHGGLVEALLDIARYHKAEQTTCMAMRCLEELAGDRESWSRIIKAGERGSLVEVGRAGIGDQWVMRSKIIWRAEYLKAATVLLDPRTFPSDGLRLLVDVLGPPPAAILKHEMDHWRHLVDPAYAAKLKRDKEEAEASRALEEKKRQQEAMASGVLGGSDSVAGTPRGGAVAGRPHAGKSVGVSASKGGNTIEKLSLEEPSSHAPNPSADSNKVTFPLFSLPCAT